MLCLENSDINLLIEWLEWRSFWVFKKTVAFYINESMTDTYRISLYLVYPNVNIEDTILLLPSCIGVQGFHDQDQYQTPCWGTTHLLSAEMILTVEVSSKGSGFGGSSGTS